MLLYSFWYASVVKTCSWHYFRTFSEPSGSLFEWYKCVWNKIYKGKNQVNENWKHSIFMHSLARSLLPFYLHCFGLRWNVFNWWWIKTRTDNSWNKSELDKQGQSHWRAFDRKKVDSTQLGNSMYNEISGGELLEKVY